MIIGGLGRLGLHHAILFLRQILVFRRKDFRSNREQDGTRHLSSRSCNALNVSTFCRHVTFGQRVVALVRNEQVDLVMKFRRMTLTSGSRMMAVVAMVTLAALTGESRLCADVATLLPEQTVVYVRIKNVADLGERLNEISLARSLRDPQVAPIMEHMWGGWLAPVLDRFREQAGVGIDEILYSIDGEFVAGLVSVSDARPALILMYQPRLLEKEENDPLSLGEAKLVEQGFDAASEQIDEVDVRVLRREEGSIKEIIQLDLDGWRVITTAREVAQTVVALRQESNPKQIVPLAEYPAFRTIRGRCVPRRGDAQIDWFVDPLELVRAFTRGNLGAAMGLAVLPVLGLDGLQGVGGSIEVANESFDTLARIHVLLESPRAGILKMIALRDGPIEPESWVPADVASYTTWHVDPMEAFETLELMFDSFRVQGALSRIIEQRISERIGVDFETELLPALSGRISIFTRFEKPMHLQSQANAVGIQLNDPVAFRSTLEKIIDQQQDRFTSTVFVNTPIYEWQRSDQPVVESEIPENETPRERRRRMRREGPRRQWQNTRPAMAIVNDALILTDQMQLLKEMVTAGNDTESRLRDELDIKLVASQLKRLSPMPLSMLRFERPEEGLRALYQTLRDDETMEGLSNNRNNPFVNAWMRAMEQNELPPFEVIAQYLAPTGSMVANEESGFHYVLFGLKR